MNKKEKDTTKVVAKETVNDAANDTPKEIIPVDSVKVYGDTAIVQLPLDAWTTMTENLRTHAAIKLQIPAYRNIRDRMFRSLFSGKEELLSLYNAVSDRDYTNPDDLEIVTLEGAIYMGMKNDISFIISNSLYLYEHQSTDNVNMPLRDLFYIAEQYRVLTVHEDIYSSRKIGLPNPHFVVLFNGKTKKPDTFEYRLSDLYLSKEDDYDLDLKVRIVNINKGHNPKMMARCKTLEEYSQFVEILRKYNETMDIAPAIHLTIEYCIDHDILKDYLLHNKAEVYSMVLYDFDVEKYKEDRENEVIQLEDEVAQLEDEVVQLSDRAEQLEDEVVQLSDKAEQLEDEVAQLADKAERLTGELERKENALAEKENALAEKDNALAEKDNALAEKENALAEKDNALAEKNNALAEKDAIIAELQKKLQNLTVE